MSVRPSVIYKNSGIESTDLGEFEKICPTPCSGCLLPALRIECGPLVGEEARLTTFSGVTFDFMKIGTTFRPIGAI